VNVELEVEGNAWRPKRIWDRDIKLCRKELKSVKGWVGTGFSDRLL